MEQNDAQLKMRGMMSGLNNHSDDVPREVLRALEDVFTSDPDFFDMPIFQENRHDDLKTILGRLHKGYRNFHQDDGNSSSFHLDIEEHSPAYEMAAHPFDSSVFQVDEPYCQNCKGKLEFTIVENLNDTGIDWIQWYCKNNCGYYYNVELI